MEVAAAQHTGSCGLAPGSQLTLLQRSEVLARIRRRKLLRLLRSTQEARDKLLDALRASEAGQLIATLGSSLASLASWDEEEVQVCNEEGCVFVSWSVLADETIDRAYKACFGGDSAELTTTGSGSSRGNALVGSKGEAA